MISDLKKRVYVIAEAGVNHNGSLKMARQLIDVAKHAGADAVKFQTFTAERLVSRSAPKAEYQLRLTDAGESQYEMIKKLELDENFHVELAKYCKERQIEFLSTPFDELAAEMLISKFGLRRLKLGSGEVTNAPLLLHVARSGVELILSTGMATLGEIETALGVLAFGYSAGRERPSRRAFQAAFNDPTSYKLLREKVTLLHCTTEYPAPFDEINLSAIHTLEAAFGLMTGFSDHSEGIAAPIAAVALGASVIEKHFTLDRGLPGPDHKASLEPGELSAMVKSIRQVELAMGNGLKAPGKSELKNRDIARKSLVAATDVSQGERFTENNLAVKRPGSGISPLEYWDYLGRSATRNFAKDELIE